MLTGTLTDYQIGHHQDEPWQSMLGRVLDSSSNEIYVFRADDYRFLKVNAVARGNLGYSEADLVTMTLPDLNRAMSGHQLDALLHPMRVGERDQVAFEASLSRKDGSSYPVEARVQFFKRSPVQKRWTDLQEVMNHVCSIRQGDPRNAEILCQVSAEGRVPKVLADPAEIQQVLFNLMQNSVEVMLQANSVTRRISLKLQSQPPGKVVITVDDRGPGLDEESRQQLFELFHTSKPDGLGLAISRSIVEAYDGHLCVDANYTEGAGIQFSLPISS
jgi:PAS domain S-box-containing protein